MFHESLIDDFDTDDLFFLTDSFIDFRGASLSDFWFHMVGISIMCDFPHSSIFNLEYYYSIQLAI